MENATATKGQAGSVPAAFAITIAIMTQTAAVMIGMIINNVTAMMFTGMIPTA